MAPPCGHGAHSDRFAPGGALKREISRFFPKVKQKNCGTDEKLATNVVESYFCVGNSILTSDI